MNELSWSFFKVWNDSLINGKEWEMKPRTHIWASELGGSYLDRYLKMSAVTPTNPPNNRALRKFQAGNLWEWILGFVLKRAGVLQSTQDYVKYQYPGLMEVTGKLDLLGGGTPDPEKAKEVIKELGLPEVLERASIAIAEDLSNKYQGKLKDIIFEIKSVSSFMFDRYDKIGKPNGNHQLQVFHYLKAKGMPEAHVVYICKDDCRIKELGVFNPSTVEELYKKDISDMTNFINNNIEPEKESEILFDPETFRFSTNWKVEYSGYLKKIYKYSEPEVYRERWTKKVSQFNSLFTRKLGDKRMTDLNKRWEEELRAYFPNLDKLILIAKEAGIPAEMKEGEKQWD